MRRHILLLLLAALLTNAASAEPRRIFALENGVLRRTLSVCDERLTTTEIRDLVTGGRLTPTAESPEFRVVLVGGRELTNDDYRASAPELNPRSLRFTLTPKRQEDPTLLVEFTARSGDQYLRKRIECRGTPVVDRFCVECLQLDAPAALGGLGQPLFLDNEWFIGLENPVGVNRASDGLVECFHHPGRAEPASYSAVLGGLAGVGREIKDEFARYLADVARPIEPMLQYNSWYDRRGKELTPESLLAAFGEFDRRLLTPFGLHFNAFVIDDGFQNPNSLWECNEQWPRGMSDLADRLEARGSRLGLWLPLNGYMLNTAWGADRGYERSDHRKRYYCLAGVNYKKAIQAALKKRVGDARPAYLKHDFNFLECTSPDHGHLPSLEHGREANVDAELALLDYERQLQPGVKLAITSGIWPSPWWLLHADYVWMGSADYAQDWTVPAWNSRNAEMTFRDARLFRLLRIDGAQIPASALMTHGLIRGRYEGIDASETTREWADYAAMFYGRGTMLHELYFSPELMPAEWWRFVGAGEQWAAGNTETLRHTQMIGGRPDHGEPYGYIHWSAGKGILCVRNPSPRPIEWRLSLAERPKHLPAVSQWTPIVVYPQRRRLEPLTTAAAPVLQLPSFSVTLVELTPAPAKSLGDLAVGPFAELARDGATMIVEYADAKHPAFVVESSRPDRLAWTAECRPANDPSILGMELQTVRRPAHGTYAPALSGATRRPAKITEMADWDLTRRMVEPGPAKTLALSASLPLTPFWPEEASLGVTVRVQRRLEEARSRPAVGAPPIWPALPEPPGIYDSEEVILDEWKMQRPRTAAESVAWLALLGAAPIVIVWRAFGRLSRSRGRSVQAAAKLIAAGLLVALYTLTPLGVALGRTLRGF